MKFPLKGQCGCGKIKVEILDEPKVFGKCHCRLCQKVTGSAFYSFLFLEEEKTKIIGEYKEFIVEGTSGKKVYRRFCPDCGSFFSSRTELVPGFISISPAILDDPIDMKLQMETWTSFKQPWDVLDPDVPHYLESRRGPKA